VTKSVHGCANGSQTAAQAASHARGNPSAQLLASAQQTLFSWSVIPLRQNAL